MHLPSLAAELRDLSAAGGKIAQDLRRQKLVVEPKPDGSIVTNADCAVEDWLRPRLLNLAPNSTLWGEEGGHRVEGAGGLWVVDPIDGTTNFAFNSPMWGVSIALVQRGEILAGAVCLPDLSETLYASKGGGVWMNERQLHCIKSGPIAPHEPVAYCQGVRRNSPGAKWPGKQRCSGAIVIDGTFFALGRVRGFIGVREMLYDMAACALFGMELGADVRYASGEPLSIADLCANVKIDQPWVMFPAGL